MTSLTFVDLPECIFLLLKEYLSQKDYRNTINSCQIPFFLELKKKSCCYYLSSKSTKDYIFNENSFQERMLSLIENPANQLGFDLCDVHSIPDLSVLGTVRAVQCQSMLRTIIINDFSVFSSVKELHFSGCFGPGNFCGLNFLVELSLSVFPGVSDISALSNCRLLNKVSIVHCERIKDINCLSHVQSLTIRGCSLTNEGISRLGSNLKRLKIQESMEITSLNHLISLEKLTIHLCEKLTSISGLLLLKELYVEFCSSFEFIADLPALKRFYVSDSKLFEMDYFPQCLISCAIESSLPFNIKGFMNFQLLTKLFVSFLNYSAKIDVNCLATLPSLRVLEISKISSEKFNIHLFQQITVCILESLKSFQGIIKPMPKLQVLTIRSCDDLKSLAGLQGNHHLKLSIDTCMLFVPDVSLYNTLLKNVDIFDYFHLSFRNSLESPEKLSKMKPYYTRQIRDKSFEFVHELPFHGRFLQGLFTNLRVLILSWFDTLPDLSQLVDAGIQLIPVLKISWAHALLSLYPPEVIPNHEWIILENCKMLENIYSIRTVPRVTIKDCPNIMDLRPLKNCSKIEFEKASEKYPRGYTSLQAKIYPVPKLCEIDQIFLNTFASKRKQGFETLLE